jgi:hypothetical protein
MERTHALLARLAEPAPDAAAENSAAATAAAALASESFAAEARYTAGLAWLRADDALDLRESELAAGVLRGAAALAGPGELRLDALYDAGVARLFEGERRHREIPEVSGTPAPPQAGTPLAPGEEPPDPLPLARAHYLAARAELVARLRADWRDPDTRANLELIQRRLRELDQIEEQRKQQEEQQQQEQQQQQGEGEQKKEPQDPRAGEQDPEGKPPEEQKPETQPPEGEESGEEQDPKPEEAQAEDAEGEQQPPAAPAATEEGTLTDEEISRLLDRLQELEDAAAQLQQAIRRQQRVPVAKDW